MQNSFRHRWRDATSLSEGGFALLQRGRSPRARERAKGARPTTGYYKTLCKTRMRFAIEKFFGSFFQKGTKTPVL